MMTCEGLSELVTDYLEGRMSFWDRAKFDLHVALCPPCKAYLAQMKTTVAALGRVPNEPIPPEVQEELLKRFRDWKQPG